MLRKQLSNSTRPFCNELLDSTICFYQFPPCEDFKLLLACSNSCELFFDQIQQCFGDRIATIEDTILSNLLTDFSCSNVNHYYIGYNNSFFLPMTNNCYSALPVIKPAEEPQGN